MRLSADRATENPTPSESSQVELPSGRPMGSMGVMLELLKSFPWFAWVAIVAVLAAAFQKIVRSIHEHEERMALIKQGKDPSKRDEDNAK